MNVDGAGQVCNHPEIFDPAQGRFVYYFKTHVGGVSTGGTEAITGVNDTNPVQLVVPKLLWREGMMCLPTPACGSANAFVSGSAPPTHPSSHCWFQVEFMANRACKVTNETKKKGLCLQDTRQVDVLWMIVRFGWTEVSSVCSGARAKVKAVQVPTSIAWKELVLLAFAHTSLHNSECHKQYWALA